MKKILFIFSALIFSSLMLQAQDAAKDTSWKVGGIVALNFNQVSLSNWTAGGDNNISLSSLATLFANYKKGHWAWDNGLILAYGETKIAKEDMRKNDDRIELQMKPGYEFKKHWYISYLFNFKTQFSPGYNYDVPDSVGRLYVSDFMAPAYMINSLGIEYKPNDDFYLYMSPATIKSTFVTVDNAKLAHSIYNVDSDKTSLHEIGFYLSARYKKEVMKNVSLATKLDLFSSYQDNPQNIDVNWEFVLSMKVNKFISAMLATTLIYDDNITVPKKKEGIIYDGKGTQFKELFGIGFSYNFAKK